MKEVICEACGSWVDESYTHLVHGQRLCVLCAFQSQNPYQEDQGDDEEGEEGDESMQYLLIGYDSEGNVLATKLYEREDDDDAAMRADFDLKLEPELKESAKVKLYRLVDLGENWRDIFLGDTEFTMKRKQLREIADRMDHLAFLIKRTPPGLIEGLVEKMEEEWQRLKKRAKKLEQELGL
jgi:hypothetical protein